MVKKKTSLDLLLWISYALMSLTWLTEGKAAPFNQKKHGGAVANWPPSMGLVDDVKALSSPPVVASACEPLTIPSCQALRLYDLAQFPNPLGHVSQSQARKALEAASSPLLKGHDLACSEALVKFTCLLYAPMCSDFQEPLPPCRSVCHAAELQCRRTFRWSGTVWPKEWSCDTFPKGALCFDLDSRVSPVAEPITGPPGDNAIPRLKTPPPVVKGTDSKRKSSSRSSDQSKTKVAKKIKAPLKPRNSKERSDMPNNKNAKGMKVTRISAGKSAPEKSRGKTGSNVFKPRLYDITDRGDPKLFRGWADVQGHGAANDYCRVVGTNSRQRFLSCALAGSTHNEHMYVSQRGFDVGHRNTWFMRDMDGDGRDDYCRCVGRGLQSKVSCMKSGQRGFFGGPMESGDQYTFSINIKGPCINKIMNPYLGP